MSAARRTDSLSGKVALRAHRCSRCATTVLEEHAIEVKLGGLEKAHLCPTCAEAAKAKKGDAVVVCARGGELVRAKDAQPVDVAGDDQGAFLYLCAACLELAAGKPKAKPAAKA